MDCLDLYILQSPTIERLIHDLHQKESHDLPFCKDTWSNIKLSLNRFLEHILMGEEDEESANHLLANDDLDGIPYQVIKDINQYLGEYWEDLYHCEVAHLDGTLHLHMARA